MKTPSFARPALLAGIALAAACTVAVPGFASGKPVRLPDPVVDAPRAVDKPEVAIFAGGCFWGVEAVFEHVKGVKGVTSGYSGGRGSTANYTAIGSGRTGHAEAVRVVYDPAQVSYGQLLKVYFSVAHDPTQLNRQGPDIGSQYRSAIFYGNDSQQKVATAYVAQLAAAKSFNAPIVTQITPLKAFYKAEDYHQDYARRNPKDRYIVIHDAPKLVHLKQLFPDLYTGG